MPVPPGRRPVALAVKHGADKLIAGVGLLITAPVLAAVAIALRLRGDRPVLRREHRVGEGGRDVVVRSFLLPGSGAWQVVERAGVATLPQLWSVLRGELSLVGPRPRDPGLEPPPARPGMTGLAQLSQLDGGLSLAEQLELDDAYARTWSLREDARIVARTVGRALR